MRIVKLDKGEYSDQMMVHNLTVDFNFKENGKGIENVKTEFSKRDNIMTINLTSNGMDKIPFTEPFALLIKDAAGTYTMHENCYFDKILDNGSFIFTFDESSTITESHYRKTKINKILEDLG